MLLQMSHPQSAVASRRQRIQPPHTREPCEIEIGGVDGRIVFQRERRDLGVGHEIAGRAGARQKPADRIDVTRSGDEEPGASASRSLARSCNCAGSIPGFSPMGRASTAKGGGAVAGAKCARPRRCFADNPLSSQIGIEAFVELGQLVVA